MAQNIDNYSFNTILVFTFRGVELEKGLVDFPCTALTCNGGSSGALTLDHRSWDWKQRKSQKGRLGSSSYAQIKAAIDSGD